MTKNDDALRALDELDGEFGYRMSDKAADNLAVIRAALTPPMQGEVRPTAWFRGVHQPSSPNGPAEYDVEMEWGDDRPQGEGWKALYSDLALPRSPPPDVARELAEALRKLETTYDTMYFKMSDGEATLLQEAWELATAALSRYDASKEGRGNG